MCSVTESVILSQVKVKQQKIESVKTVSNIENITFGIEIETSIPLSTHINIGPYHHGLPVTVAQTATVSQVTAPLFNGAAWKAERDCSIIPFVIGQYDPCEFVSPVLRGEAGIQHLLEFVSFLNAIGAKVNASCGLHIHIGVNGTDLCTPETRQRFINILARLAAHNSIAMYAQTGTPARELGRFCRKTEKHDRKHLLAACRKENFQALSRYQLLNLTNVPTRGTVEFRCFAGTLNTTKILMHLLSVLVLCKVASPRKTCPVWDHPAVEPTGEQALSALLKRRPVFEIVQAKAFADNRTAILEKAIEMATKYDAAKATLNRAVPQTPPQYVPSHVVRARARHPHNTGLVSNA